MKTPSSYFLFLQSTSAAVALTLLLSLVGCASLNAPNDRSLLSAAGFITRTPQTPQQREVYATAPAYHVQRVAAQGKVFYVYKDEKNGLAYVGGEPEYQRYQRLAVQQRIAVTQYQAAEMNRDAAMGWYGAYGPYAVGGPFPYGAPVRRFR